MEPKPVITYFGDVEILGTVLQKKLQNRLIQLQVQSLSREEGEAFSSLCNGVEFLHFVTAQEKSKLDLPFYQRPALHTFWCGCSDTERYRSHDKPLIKQWLDNIAKLGCGDHAPAMTLVIYCVTAEVRAKRQRPLAHIASTSVEERLRTDYKTLVDDIIIFRLASSEESRLVDSFHALVSKLNHMMLTQSHKDIEIERETIARRRGTRSDPQHFYTNLFLKKLHLAVGYEMTVRNEEALSQYSEATTDLEDALTMFADSASPPQWLEDIRKAPCTTWDYPKLAWTQLSWQYLSGIHTCSSPLLHTRTFLLVRVAHLLFVLERAWSVSELAISTLHCMAREIKMLKLTFPSGAFDCWAYMTCNEAILSFMARISLDSLESATSSLLLVRAELWHYALQKLHDIGVLCGLMPSSNKLNHDTVLIKHISSGINPVPPKFIDASMIGVEDQGQKLLTILNDRQAFQTEFLVLGEMVIGAFKHAGRRRMAFRVGTMIAQFHRDLGLVVEAEELLSDICKFYSEDQWTELSTKAYSLLADCQMKLRLEDKHVTTMLLLASLPPYPAASHDPLQWMDQITRIAQRSPYQKLLTWEPLLELVKMEVVEKKDTYSTEDTVQLELVIKMHGPKEMKSLIATLHTRLAASLHDLPTTSSTSHTPHHKAPPHSHSPNISISSTPNMEELDLELNVSHLPHSRPIGGSGKLRSSTQVVTHISHAALTEMEMNWQGQGEDSLKGKELMLSAMKITLSPGENRVRLQGKPSRSGEFAPHKISLKFGSLDFAYTIAADQAKENIISVQDPPVNVDIALSPTERVFLAGCEQRCMLSFVTSCGTAIPDGAAVRVVVHKDIHVQLQLPAVSVVPNKEAGTTEHHFTLPAIPSDASHECHMTLKLPATHHVSTTMPESNDQPEQLPAWKYEVDVFCDWLTPCYVATLPLTAYEPLSLTCLEHSAGETSFLQLLLQNTCPLPVLIRSPVLTAPVSLQQLHGPLPEVFFPLENYSFLWKAEPSHHMTQEHADSSFAIELSFLPFDFDWDKDDLPTDPTYISTHFDFALSNMKTVFEVDASVEPVRDQMWVVAHRAALLVYTIRNITEQPPPETQFGATPPNTEAMPTKKECKLGYEVCADKVWSLQDQAQGKGVVDIPGAQLSTKVQFTVVPNASGSLPMPHLLLKWVPSDSKARVLTNAQAYDASRGQMATVHTSSSAGR